MIYQVTNTERKVNMLQYPSSLKQMNFKMECFSSLLVTINTEVIIFNIRLSIITKLTQSRNSRAVALSTYARLRFNSSMSLLLVAFDLDYKRSWSSFLWLDLLITSWMWTGLKKNCCDCWNLDFLRQFSRATDGCICELKFLTFLRWFSRATNDCICGSLSKRWTWVWVALNSVVASFFFLISWITYSVLKISVSCNLTFFKIILKSNLWVVIFITF